MLYLAEFTLLEPLVFFYLYYLQYSLKENIKWCLQEINFNIFGIPEVARFS